MEHDFGPSGVRRIGGPKDARRVRLGSYRIIYEIDDQEKSIFVYRIRDRKEAIEISEVDRSIPHSQRRTRDL
ncbi:MAG: type II toxin-antitoxin system RelE/ParE family toxin [Nitrospirae bacterium]|nr:type II toxin-antitoxin system RelE/ParE family toxin [Nitrospirota bacterium]